MDKYSDTIVEMLRWFDDSNNPQERGALGRAMQELLTFKTGVSNLPILDLSLNEQEKAAAQRSQIEALKMLRARTGASLRTAKAMVEHYLKYC